MSLDDTPKLSPGRIIGGLVVLSADVAVTDHPYSSEHVVLGVFNDMIEMGRAMGAFERGCRHRVAFRQTELTAVNAPNEASMRSYRS